MNSYSSTQGDVLKLFRKLHLKKQSRWHAPNVLDYIHTLQMRQIFTSLRIGLIHLKSLTATTWISKYPIMINVTAVQNSCNKFAACESTLKYLTYFLGLPCFKKEAW